MAILQTTTESVLHYKSSCALSGLHTSCPCTYRARPHLPPCAVPCCCANCVAFRLPTLISCGLPSCSPLSSRLCLLPSLSSASGVSCSPSHLLTAFYFTTHTRLLHPPSSLSFLNLRLSCLTFPYYSIYSCQLLPSSALFSSPSPSLSPCVCPAAFSEDPRSIHLCVDAEAVCLTLFYSIIHFSFQSFSLINCNITAKKRATDKQ